MTRKMLLAQAAFGGLLAITLSGCVADEEVMTGGVTQAPQVHGSDNYPITVNKGTQVLEIPSDGSRLLVEDRDAIKAFLTKAKQAGVADLTISYPETK